MWKVLCEWTLGRAAVISSREGPLWLQSKLLVPKWFSWICQEIVAIVKFLGKAKVLVLVYSCWVGIHGEICEAMVLIATPPWNINLSSNLFSQYCARASDWQTPAWTLRKEILESGVPGTSNAQRTLEEGARRLLKNWAQCRIFSLYTLRWLGRSFSPCIH
jgi:hypothetical protein